MCPLPSTRDGAVTRISYIRHPTSDMGGRGESSVAAVVVRRVSSPRSIQRLDPSLAALEFGHVLELVAIEAKSTPGKRALLARRPATTLGEAERAQAELAEMTGWVAREGLLPLAGLTDVSPLLSGDQPLEFHDSWLVLRAARATQAMREAILRSDWPVPHLAAVGEEIADLSEAIAPVARFFTRDGKLREEASAELRSIRSRIHAKRASIQRTLGDLMHRHADAIQDPIITLRGDRYCIPVRSERRGEVQGIFHERSGSGASMFIEPIVIVEMNNDLADLLQHEREEIARITRFVAQQLLSRRDEIVDAVESAARLDAIQACSIVGSLLESSRPSFDEGGTLRLLDARHPLLDERVATLRQTAFGETEQTRVVPTTLILDAAHPALVVTGPNAGGKTVALKTAGLLVAMAAAGLPVPAAEGSVVPVVDSLYVLVGDDQDVMEHLSTFTAYLVRLRRVLDRVTSRSFVLLDELGSGTDPEEGSALASAVVEHLLEVGCRLLVTTHLAALKSLAIADERVENASMEFDPESGRPTFRLIRGVPGRSRALEVAESIGLPLPLLARAKAALGERYGDVDRLLAELQKKTGEITQERNEARELRTRLAGELAEAKKLRKEADEERKKVSRLLRDEVDQFKRDMRAKLAAEIEQLRAADRVEREKLSSKKVVERLGTLPEPALEAAVSSRPPRVGDRVEHRRFRMAGDLVSIDGARGTLSVGGKKIEVDVADLIVLSDAAARDSKKRPTYASSGAADKPSEPAVSAELNLIGRRVEEALEESDRFIDQSLLSGRGAVRLIHGHGTGTLRKALREHLRSHPGVRSFRPGGEREGGDGATVALLDV
jgi:DNA mismatch repair protein MutS2